MLLHINPIEENNYWIKIIMIELNKNMKYY